MLTDFFIKRTAKSKLIQTFRSGELYLTYESGSKKHLIFPKIRSIKITDNKATYIFTLPLGLNPTDITKKRWLFEQQFGTNIELEQHNRNFLLTIYRDSIPANLTWRYSNIEQSIARLSLPIYCGVDINGQHIAYDMIKHPHLLIAGETGSGKSTQVRSVLTTLIKTLDASRLHLYLADLKRSEFHLFRRIEHVKKVCTRISELMLVLSYLRREVEKRGDLLDEHEVMHIDDLPTRLPYLVLCIDEVALLKKEKEAMEIIEDISAVGRALGIFLILSMQRPDAKVLDGKLKVNLTVRMGFRCADLINSRIVGTPGAEKLKELGRMILKLEELTEVQVPHLTDEQAKKELEPYKVEAFEDTEVVEQIDSEQQGDKQVTEQNIFGLLEGD